MFKKITFIFLLVMGLNCFAVAKSITLTTSVWEPYVIGSGSNEGYAYDIVKQAFEVMGYQVNIKVMPSWNEAISMSLSGEVDGLFPAYFSRMRAREAAFSNPFLAGPLVIYKRKNTQIDVDLSLINSNQEEFFNKLQAYKFGVVTGTVHTVAFDNNKTLHKIYVDSDAANLKVLYDGKVDLIIMDKLNAQYILRHDLPGKYKTALTYISPPIRKNSLYVLFSKKGDDYKTFLNDFNAGLVKLQENKVTNQIMRKYIYDFIDKDSSPKRLRGLQY